MYKSEVNVWNLDQFDSERIKAKCQRFVPPVTENCVEEEKVAPEFKNEFETSPLAITGLDDTDEEKIVEVLDKRERHQLVCYCWLNNEEVLVSTRANYIFKVLKEIFSYFEILN